MVLIAAIALSILIYTVYPQIRGIGPAISKPPADIADLIENGVDDEPTPATNNTHFPLTLPQGLTVSLFAKNLPSARVLAFDSRGNLWVSQINDGTITRLDVFDGKVAKQTIVFSGLRKPHGLAFDPQDPNTLYIAEEHRVSKVMVYPEIGTMEKLVDLNTGGGHVSRTIGFLPDGRLLVSIGSTCNVCHEKNEQRAKFYVMNKDGSHFKEYARGTRNSVFFTMRPGTQEVWATEMGRDLLGDDLPPDEINVINENANYGWPTCYGQNIHDTSFDKNTYIRNPCMEPFETPAKVDLQAHSAPLGLAFAPASWPNDYVGDLIVAYHGSWNRSVPTGYKLVRIKLAQDGSYQGTEDFVTGWLTKDGALGRPVDVIVGPDDKLYVSDDKAGLVYQMTMAK